MARKEDSSGTTTNCTTQYRAEDQAQWGHPVPSPVPAYGLRISRPEIIHGSTNAGHRRRRVIYTWLTGIQEDHHTLDNPDALNWDEVAACHRDLEAPSKGVGGDRPTHSVPPFRFPASSYMESSYALGDALLGRRKWTDPEVLYQRDVLLGTDDRMAWVLVEKVRSKMLTRFLHHVRELEVLERKMFGSNSFFVSRDAEMDMVIE